MHKAKVAQAALKDCGFVEIPHPPYSPDLAPSDYFLFPNLKKKLRGRKFSSDYEVQSVVNDYFMEQKKTFFLEGLGKLIDRCNKCINLKGDYVEK